MPRKTIKKKISEEKSNDMTDYPIGPGKEFPVNSNMPMIGGINPPGFNNPQEIKEGGVAGGKEEKTPSQVIKENTPKDAARIFIEERIKNRNELKKRKEGQYYFEFSEGGINDSSKSKSNMDYDDNEYRSKNKEMDDYLETLMDAVYEEKITPEKASDLLQYAGKNLSATEGSFKKGGMAMDESIEHENKESKKQEARETRLERKGYRETKSGKMIKGKQDGGMVRGYGAAIKGKNFKGIF